MNRPLALLLALVLMGLLVAVDPAALPAWDPAEYAWRGAQQARAWREADLRGVLGGWTRAELHAPGWPSLLGVWMAVFGAGTVPARLATLAFALLGWGRLYRSMGRWSGDAGRQGTLLAALVAFTSPEGRALATSAMPEAASFWLTVEVLRVADRPWAAGVGIAAATWLRYALGPTLWLGLALARGWRDRWRRAIPTVLLLGVWTGLRPQLPWNVADFLVNRSSPEGWDPTWVVRAWLEGHLPHPVLGVALLLVGVQRERFRPMAPLLRVAAAGLVLGALHPYHLPRVLTVGIWLGHAALFSVDLTGPVWHRAVLLAPVLFGVALPATPSRDYFRVDPEDRATLEAVVRLARGDRLRVVGCSDWVSAPLVRWRVGLPLRTDAPPWPEPTRGPPPTAWDPGYAAEVERWADAGERVIVLAVDPSDRWTAWQARYRDALEASPRWVRVERVEGVRPVEAWEVGPTSADGIDEMFQ